MIELAKRLARRTRAYGHYQAWKAARWTAGDEDRCALYREFLRPHDLAFDVGANMANRTRVFRRLGARVVAVEPQAACVDVLRRVFRDDRDVTIEPCALGKEPGHAELHIADAHVLATLSDEWIARVKPTGRFGGERWARTVRVPVTTLDALIARHGVPAFIKIDVEGHEDRVLAGLSQPVPALSFEFTPEHADLAIRCFDELRRLGDAHFNYGMYEEPSLRLGSWVTEDAMRAELERLRSEPGAFGDIYVRFSSG